MLAEAHELQSTLRRVQSARLIGSFDDHAGPELVLSAQRVTGIDVFGAVMLRAAIEDWLARDPARKVTLVEPEDDGAFGLLRDFFSHSFLPRRCRWAGTRGPGTRGSNVIMEVQPVPDEAARFLMTEILAQRLPGLGYGKRRVRPVLEALGIFVDNALTHGSQASRAPLVSVAFDPQALALQAAVLDCGPAPEPLRGEVALEEAVAGTGSVNDLVDRRRAGLHSRVWLAWGDGRAFWHPDKGEWETRGDSFLPGFLAGIEITR